MKNTIRNAFIFVFSGNLIKYIVKWFVTFLGNISDSMMIISTIWLSLDKGVHPWIVKLVGQESVYNTNNFVQAFLLVIPEVIAYGAIKKAFDHWGKVKSEQEKSQRKEYIGWAIALTLPTAIFLGLTFLLLNSPLDSQISGFYVNVRITTAWVYSIIIFLNTDLRSDTTDLQQQLYEVKEEEKVVQVKPQRKVKVNEVKTEGQKLIEAPQVNSEAKAADLEESNISDIQKPLSGQKQVESHLENIDFEERSRLWVNKSELMTLYGVKQKTIERAFTNICPEVKSKRA